MARTRFGKDGSARDRLALLLLVVAVASARHAAASPFSTQPRIPDDMRDTAQEAADAMRAQHYDAAAADFQHMLDKYPDSLYAWSNLGVVRSQQGGLDEAIRAFRHAAQLDADDALVQADLGLCLSREGDDEDAVPALKRAARLDPGNAFTQAELGWCLFDLKRYEAAIPALERAEKLDPGNANLHALLARCYQQAGRDDEARRERQAENVQQIQMFR